MRKRGAMNNTPLGKKFESPEKAFEYAMAVQEYRNVGKYWKPRGLAGGAVYEGTVDDVFNVLQEAYKNGKIGLKHAEVMRKVWKNDLSSKDLVGTEEGRYWFDAMQVLFEGLKNKGLMDDAC